MDALRSFHRILPQFVISTLLLFEFVIAVFPEFFARLEGLGLGLDGELVGPSRRGQGGLSGELQDSVIQVAGVDDARY